jgi:hypothetical protein
MKSPSLAIRSHLALLVLAVALCAGCATDGHKPSPCPARYSFHYQDAARGFSLCLPTGLQKADANGTTVFTGFAVPPGTNLQEKKLVVVTGNYDEMQGAKAAGSLTADGVVLKRVQLDEGSAGHSTLHVIYTWKNGAKNVHFDFTHRAVNVGNFDPPNRPAEYDRPAQIQITEEIMRTFKRLN